MYMDKNKHYLITGGSGFLAYGLIDYLTNNNIMNISILARNEGNLIKVKQMYPHINIITGNLCDKKVVYKALDGISGVFHLAAFKHVGLAERYPLECIQSNINATLTLLECGLDFDIDFIVGISTDKVCQVSGVYGATKYLMEKIFDDYEKINKKTQYRIVRYGNVLYSTGSVLCKWKDLIQQGKEVIITDANATRFYWTVEQAVQLIIDCLKNSKDTTPYIPEMKSIRMGDLLRAMIEKYSNGIDIPVKVIGLQKGENLHEKIDENGMDSNETPKYSITEIKKLI